MTITVNQAMLTTIKDDIDDGWDGEITYSIDVLYGTFFGYLWDAVDWFPDLVGTSVDNVAAIKEAVELWDDLIGESISFVYNNDESDIIINTVSNLPEGTGGVTQNTIHSLLPNDADMFLPQTPMLLGNFAWGTIVHEFGHALGLQHPGDYDASDGPITIADRDFDEDTVQYSVMSYFDPAEYTPGINWNRSNNHPQTPMIYDILAIQPYYNVDTTTRLGETTYGFNSTAGRSVFDFTVNKMPVLTIWDAGGLDELDLSGFPTAQRIDLSEGSYSDVGVFRNGETPGTFIADTFIQNVGIAFGTWIENAVGGSGADRMDGNALGNRLDGGLGADTAYGLAGADRLIGGGGDDLLYGDTGADTLVGGAGADLLNGGADFDTAEYSAAAGETITIRPVGTDPSFGTWTITGALEGAGDLLAQIEAFRFGNGDDRISTAGATANFSFNLDGRGGDDIIRGGDGTDTLTGGDGSDSLRPGTGVFHVYGGQMGATAGSWIERLASNDELVVDRSGDLDGYWLDFSASPSVPVGVFSGGDGSTARGIARLHYLGGVASDRIQGGLGGDSMDGRDGADILVGNWGDDSLDGGAGADELYGRDGADTLLGGLGQDSYYGGEGDDLIVTGGGGDFRVFGEAGKDTISGTDDAEQFQGGADHDQLYGEGGNDILNGEAGNDLIQGGLGDDYVDPGVGVETLDGGAGGADRLNINRSTTTRAVSFFLNGPAGSDGTQADNFETLSYAGGSGSDTVRGSSNSDTLVGNGGGDVLEGMAGVDEIYGRDGADTLRGGLGQDWLFGGDGDDNIETGGGGDFRVFGEAGNDTISGTDDAEQFQGGADNDKLYGYGGNDILNGEAGNDLIQGGAGDDHVDPGVGAETLDGGDGGADRLTINRSTTALGVSFYLDGPAGSDGTRAANFELLSYSGGSGADTVRGSAGADTLVGNGGDDVLDGGAGADGIYGRDGADTLIGGLGANHLHGDEGFDTASYAASLKGVKADLSTGSANHGYGTDQFQSIEAVIGSAKKDVLTGNGGANLLTGGDGGDRLRGGDGNDTLSGGDGGDNIDGGEGVDRLEGGAGIDRFFFASVTGPLVTVADLIVDLSAADVIDLSLIDADANAAGDQAFVLVDGFTGHAGEAMLFFHVESGRTRLRLDVTGDGKPDGNILIEGDHTEFANFAL